MSRTLARIKRWRGLSAALAALVVPLLAASAATAQQDWVEVRSSKDGFVVSMPAEPKESTTTEGSVVHRSYELTADRMVYTIICTVLPHNPPSPSRSIETELNDIRDGVIRSAESKVLTERDVVHDGRVGREVEFLSNTRTSRGPSGYTWTERTSACTKSRLSTTRARPAPQPPGQGPFWSGSSGS